MLIMFYLLEIIMEDLICGLSWQEIQNKQQGIDTGKKVDTSKAGDYGCDPLPNGTYKMVPSGDIVDIVERDRRLNNRS
jgi:hypothetical protein